ncbi:anti-sigma factor domain-containing protein [Marinisporobacter balticus]|uniref:Anti-sigma factor-like protein n=1 Tax=Marinisporobacter balticus TaxID=2018667 RepID=A0A4R2KUC4_9FIRM|nr:anti-sigma factor domain-containing protein [Marinisporobacter balticus]TCO76407.1 anti-sigma factor-like protein [Marinisporobacter balticus]
MVYRGCILKIEEDFAIVLTDQGQYLKIIKKEDLVVGKKIIFVKEDIYKDRRVTIKNIGLIAAVFITMILSITGIGKFHIVEPMRVAAVVSIDINPSIEFEINEKKKVLHVGALNMDGEELIDQTFIGMSIEEAVLLVINNAKQKHYITKEKNTVLIATAAVENHFKEKSDKLQKEIEQKMKDDQKLKELNLIYVQGNKKDLKEAKKQKISIGKYQVYKQSKEKEQKITLEQVKNMKVQEMVDKGIGKLKGKKIKTKIKEKVEDKIKKQQETTKEEKKEAIKQDRENKSKNIIENKEKKKKAVQIKNKAKIDEIENKQEEKKEKITFNQENKKERLENKKERLENKKDIEKEKREIIEENKKEQKKEKVEMKKMNNEENNKKVTKKLKENRKTEPKNTKETRNTKPYKENLKKAKKD